MNLTRRYSDNYLLLAAIIMLFSMLGSREAWTLETRWANIVLEMIVSKDFFHPMLMGHPYYDKPLLSYWLIYWASKFTDGLSLWSLRVPSALSALGTVWCIYRLGKLFFDEQVGRIAGWLLITSYYFVFWGRVASADMLNVFGNLLAFLWFCEHRRNPSWRHYFVFCMILSVTSLCKGLLGVVLPLLMIMPILIEESLWRQCVNYRLLLASLPAIALYLLPFIESSISGGGNYSENGLSLVFRENITRFVHPWDHQGPWYLYFLYVPIYCLPWSLFFYPVFKHVLTRYRQQKELRFVVNAILLLFAFFTSAGSRRSYYVLPMVPLFIILVAHWAVNIQSRLDRIKQFLVFFYVALWLCFAGFFPLYYSVGGPQGFVAALNQVTLPQSTMVLINADNKIPLYLGQGQKIDYLSLQSLPTWLQHHHTATNFIFITKQKYRHEVHEMLTQNTNLQYREVHIDEKLSPWRIDDRDSQSWAFVPQQSS